MTEVIFKKHPDTLIPLETQKASCIWISFFIHNFIYFWLCWVFTAVRAFLQLQKAKAALQRGCGLLIAGISLAVEPAFQGTRLKWPWHAGSVAEAPGHWGTGSVALAHGPSCFLAYVASSRIRDRTTVSCIGRQTVYRQATRETPGTLIQGYKLRDAVVPF